MRTTVLKNTERMYELSVGPEGEHYLTVVAGGVAMYELTIRLTDGEVERYTSEGEPFVRDLAYKLGKNEADYAERLVRE